MTSLRLRPEWNDVQPIPEFEGAPPIAPIDYSEHFAEVMGYFRAVLQSQEVSDRAFELTAEVIGVNPSFYTAWQYRLVLFRALNKPAAEELKFVGRVASKHPKNYQLWYYRREILSQLQEAHQELEFVEMILDIDEKNVHAWCYRKWVVEKFSLWQQELEYVSDLISRDPRNNSAWNQRFNAVRALGKLNEVVGLADEVDFVLQQINSFANNESPWSYLRGLTQLVAFPEELIEQILSLSKSLPKCSFALAFLVFWHEKKGGVQEAREAAEKLVVLDAVRAKYWAYRASRLSI